jgi:hypothetical protein
MNSSGTFRKVIQVGIFIPDGAVDRLPPHSSAGSNPGTHFWNIHIPYLDLHGVSNKRARTTSISFTRKMKKPWPKFLPGETNPTSTFRSSTQFQSYYASGVPPRKHAITAIFWSHCISCSTISWFTSISRSLPSVGNLHNCESSQRITIHQDQVL